MNNTLIYTQQISVKDNEFHVRVAKNFKENEELIEAGFEYVTEREGIKIYGKPK